MTHLFTCRLSRHTCSQILLSDWELGYLSIMLITMTNTNEL